jgi:hypothetical protein
MTLAKARVKACAQAKHIYNTGVNYDNHLRLSKYFYSTGHCIHFMSMDKTFPFIFVIVEVKAYRDITLLRFNGLTLTCALAYFVAASLA